MESILIKRQNFHSSIRKQQLDKYRQNKRKQLFAFNSHQSANQQIDFKQQNNNESVNNFLKIINKKIYPFDKDIQNFYIDEFQKRLRQSNNDLNKIQQIINLLVTLRMNDLNKFERFQTDMINRYTKLIMKCMKKVKQIPKVSSIRIDNLQKIEQMERKMMECTKMVVFSILDWQNTQKQQKKNFQRKKEVCKRLISSRNRHLGKDQRDEYENKLKELQRNELQDSGNTNHPIDYCNEELFTIWNLFFEDFISNQSQNDKITEIQQFQNKKDHSEMYYIQISYILSFVQSQVFTPRILEQFLNQITNFGIISIKIADVLIQIINNFVSMLQSRFKNQKNSFPSINYSDQNLNKIIIIINTILQNFDMGDQTFQTIINSVKLLLNYHPKKITYFIYQSGFIKTILRDIKKQKDYLFEQLEKLNKSQISKQVYEEKIRMNRIKKQIKVQFYELLGSLFSSSDYQELKFINQLICQLIQIVFYQIRQLTEKDEKSLSFSLGNFELKEQNQKVVQSVCFILFNLFACDSVYVNRFVQKHILRQLFKLWNYCCTQQNYFTNYQQSNKSIQQANSLPAIQKMIIYIFHNMVFIFFADKYNTSSTSHDQLDVIIQYDNCRIVKLLIGYLKAIAYENTRWLIDNQLVLYALKTLNKLLQCIWTNENREILVEVLQNDGQYNLEEVLNTIMIKNDKFEQKITNCAMACLQIFDKIKEEGKGNSLDQKQNFRATMYGRQKNIFQNLNNNKNNITNSYNEFQI